MPINRIKGLVGRFDWLMFAGVFLVLGISLVTLYSIAIGREGGDLFVFKKQLVFTVVGLFLFFVLSFVDFHTWESSSRWLYLGVIFLLFATLIFGQVAHGTRGWIGFGSWRFQSVEIAKLIAVIILAAYFSRRTRELDKFSNLFQSFFLAGSFAGLVFFQPDFGSATVIIILWLGLVLISGVRRRYIIGLISTAIMIFLFAWFFMFQSYQKERLITFFSPTANSGSSYNVRQATIAVGAGGLTGRGLGEGSQSQLRFLPEAETDFIFAVVAEELGFVGVSILIGLFVLLYYRLFRLLIKCSDWFASFVVLGTVILFSIEIFINAGMSMGLFPVVGIPFPLLSAGGSSLLAHLILLGIIENIAVVEGSKGYQVSRVSAL